MELWALNSTTHRDVSSAVRDDTENQVHQTELTALTNSYQTSISE